MACINALSRNSLGGTEKDHKNITQGGWCRGRELNPASPKYKCGVLPQQQSARSLVKAERFKVPLLAIRTFIDVSLAAAAIYVYVYT
jgi:hypothetical protein